MPDKLVMLAVNNLFCERDQRILFTQLNFNVEAGQIWQIEGQNGSGKTSLLRILSGLSDAFEGAVVWQGQPLDKVREHYYQSMLYIGHLTGIKAALTAEENLAWMVHLSPHLNQLSLAHALKKVGLYGFEDVPCHTLSAGQQRRVSLARLYLSSAPLWILDEPFTALDKKGVAEKEALITQHVETGGAVILTTHHPLNIMPKRLRYLNLDHAKP
jgi:heme exporter protein A